MSDVDWVAIRDAYESGKMSLRQIASHYSVSKTTIIDHRNKEHWHRPTKTRPNSETQGVIHSDMNAAVRATLGFKLRYEEYLTWEEVASRAGYASRGSAKNAVDREAARHISQNIEEIRSAEFYRLERLQSRCYKEAMDPDNESWTWATDRYAVLSKRKSELMNLDIKPNDQATQQNYTKRIILTHTTNTTPGGQIDGSGS